VEALENCVQKAVDRLWAKCKVIQEGVPPGQPSRDGAAKLSFETESSLIGITCLEARILQ
jgi:hypothetical protein